MIFTKMTDYALRIILELSKRGKGVTLTMDEIAENQRIPKSFIPKIVPELVRRGIIRTERGRHGGISLIKDPGEISLYDIISAFERIDYFGCVSTPSLCELSEICPMYTIFKKATVMMEKFFNEVDFESLASHSNRG